MIKIKCLNCGYEKEVMDSEADDIRHEKCFICQGDLTLADNKEVKEEHLIEELIYEDMIDRMEDNIIQLGHKKTWDIIEKFINPKQRIAYRKLFFEAGGEIPKSDIKI